MSAQIRILSTLLLISLCTLQGQIARASWPSDPGLNLPICTAANIQSNPVIASDGAGGADMAWEDYRRGDGIANLFIQRVNLDGAVQWTVNGVEIWPSAWSQLGPAIVPDGSGGAFVAWSDLRFTHIKIFAQRVDGSGMIQWNVNGVGICSAISDQDLSAMISDAAGGVIIAWKDTRDGISGIYAQRVSPTGLSLWAVGGVKLCAASGGRYSPRLVSDGAGGAIATWYDNRSSAGDIYAQRVSAAGVNQWIDDGVPVCTAIGDQANPAITTDGAGGAIITWSDFRDSRSHIYAQRVNQAGDPQWLAGGVALCTAARRQAFPTLLPDGFGGAIVTWTDSRADTSSDIYAQRVNGAGVPQWSTDGIAVCDAPGYQDSPVILADGARGTIFIWVDGRSGTTHLYSQRLSAAGLPAWVTNGVVLCSAPGGQGYPTAIPDGSGGALVGWFDGRNGNPDIYAQRIRSDGALGGSLLGATSPSGFAVFSLQGARPNPCFDRMTVSYSLPDVAPATLELFDLAGRRIESIQLGGLGAGSHLASMTTHGRALHPGIYGLRLSQGTRRAFAKVVVLE